MPRDGRPEVAFVGRSNVGKSSLINALLNRKSLARTSSTPGKTQTVNFFLINDTLYVVDLPGLGYAKVSKGQRAAWEKMIRAYLESRPTLTLLVHLVDGRHKPTEIDLAVTDLSREIGCNYVIALTKMDKLNQKDRSKARKRLAGILASGGLEPPIVETSAIKKTGMRELWGWIDTLS